MLRVGRDEEQLDDVAAGGPRRQVFGKDIACDHPGAEHVRDMRAFEVFVEHHVDLVQAVDARLHCAEPRRIQVQEEGKGAKVQERPDARDRAERDIREVHCVFVVDLERGMERDLKCDFKCGMERDLGCDLGCDLEQKTKNEALPQVWGWRLGKEKKQRGCLWKTKGRPRRKTFGFWISNSNFAILFSFFLGFGNFGFLGVPTFLRFGFTIFSFPFFHFSIFDF